MYVEYKPSIISCLPFKIIYRDVDSLSSQNCKTIILHWTLWILNTCCM